MFLNCNKNMKRLFEFVLYLFYRYYNRGSTKIIAYESALIAVSALVFLNVLAVLMFFDVDITWVDKIEKNYGKFVKLIVGILVILPLYFVLFSTIKKENITKRKADNLKVIKKWNVVLVSYIVVSVLLLIISVKMR